MRREQNVDSTMDLDGNMKYSPINASAESLEWNYEMRREMQEIIPGLYLGPYAVAMKSKCEHLLEHHITHIVCIRQQLEAHVIRPNFPHLFKYLVLDIADCLSENIIQHFPKVKQFLEECFTTGGKALVHGNAGISRSAALVIAYIMEKYGLTYREAYVLVQQRRFCIGPNERFAQQLKEYEPIYRAKCIIGAYDDSRFSNGRLKRPYDDGDEEDDEMRR